jgi:aerobic carbon-monoxide dehydrogenase large subunit
MLNGNMADISCRSRPRCPTSEWGTWCRRLQIPSLAQSAGEAGTAGATGAVANAVNDALSALGARNITQVPITPERVLRALGKG